MLLEGSSILLISHLFLVIKGADSETRFFDLYANILCCDFNLYLVLDCQKLLLFETDKTFAYSLHPFPPSFLDLI
jgi:hypothetical protein